MAFVTRARHRLARQEGIALPVSVMSLMLVLSLSGLVLQQSMAVGDSANREQRSKRAIQAADAGLDVAVFRVSKIATATDPCPVIGGTGFAGYENIAGELWCPEVQENAGDGKSYAYRVSAPAANGDRRVVATGTADGLTRRVAVTSVKAIQPLFFGYGVSSDSDIELASSAQIGQMSPQIVTHARANGNIILSSSANICGNATPGPGKTVTDTSSYGVCPGYSTAPASAPIVFPEVDDSVAKTTNDNDRICVVTLDPCAPTSDVQWNSSAKTLRMNSSSTLILRGSVYYFCSIVLNSSSRMILDPPDTSKPVLIFVGGPSDCPGQPTEVIRMNSSTRVESAPGKTVTVQFLVKGSDSSASTVSWNSSSLASTITALYAPNSDIRMDSSSRIFGGISGKSVLMNSSAQVFYDDRADRDPFDDAARKSATYRECRPQATAGASPDEGC
jgi:hypothetical protein